MIGGPKLMVRLVLNMAVLGACGWPGFLVVGILDPQGGPKSRLIILDSNTPVVYLIAPQGDLFSGSAPRSGEGFRTRF